MTSVDDVIAFSNQGIDFIRTGYYDRAIDFLHQGLSALKEVVYSSSEVESPPGDTIPTFQFLGTHDSANDEPELDVSTCDTFVFQNPILIRYHRSGRMLANTEFSIKLSFAILYNLALAHHLNAQVAQQSSGLARALAFYKAAYKIQMGGCFYPCLETMAVLNNMGQIYKSFKDYKSSRLCLECLASNIMLLRDRGWVLEEYSGFIVSVLPLMLTAPCCAGAA